MKVNIEETNDPNHYFVYLNGRPVDAIAADEEEGWVELFITDRHGRLIPHIGFHLCAMTAKATGHVKILKRDKPPEDWDVDMALDDLPLQMQEHTVIV